MTISYTSERDGLAARIRGMREYLGYTQQQVADYLGIHRPSLSEMEAGRRGVDSLELKKIAKLFRTPIEYFLGTEEEKVIEETTELVKGLDEEDRKEVLRYAEYLTWRKRYKEEKDEKIDKG